MVVAYASHTVLQEVYFASYPAYLQVHSHLFGVRH